MVLHGSVRWWSGRERKKVRYEPVREGGYDKHAEIAEGLRIIVDSKFAYLLVENNESVSLSFWYVVILSRPIECKHVYA